MGATTKPFYDSIFWVEVDKIRPNPLQPRRDFDEARLRELTESVRQYGILQPLVVTRHEIESPDGSIRVEYELIAGERRWRAAKMAGLSLVPVVIRTREESDKMKLELAIIENLQREDLNPVERAEAFKKLQEYGYNNAEIARKIGKSREYVSNTLRILNLPEEILQALRSGVLAEGFSRPLLMLNDKPQEQKALFEEILERKLTVRETERIARRIAAEKVRKPFSPEVNKVEQVLARILGTRVMITPRQQGKGGKIVIDYFSEEDLRVLLDKLSRTAASQPVPSSQPSHAASPAPSTTEQPENPAQPAAPSLVPTRSASTTSAPTAPLPAPTPAPSPAPSSPTQPAPPTAAEALTTAQPAPASALSSPTQTPPYTPPTPSVHEESPSQLPSSEHHEPAPSLPPSSPAALPPTPHSAPLAPNGAHASSQEGATPPERPVDEPLRSAEHANTPSHEATPQPQEEDDSDLYAVRNFTI